MLAEGSSMAATITVHEPDGEGRVFVDVIGPIDKDDFKTFKDKTDQLYPTAFGHSKMQVIVTLVSYGGSASPAWQIGDWIRKRGMSTFVPGDRTCTSACALIWLAGVPRMVGDTPQIGFHAVYDPTTRRETGPGNAVVGAYLRDLGIGYKAIVVMTRKGPTAVEWLSPDLAKELGVAWSMLQSPRAIPLPLQPKLQPRLQPPPQVIAAWSQSARSHRNSERKAAEAEQQRLKEEVQRQKAAADADARRRTAEAEQQRLRDELQRQIKAPFEIRPNMEARPLSSVAFKLIVVSVDECQQKCAESTDCKVFSFSKASNICYSYSDAEFAPNAAFDSGVRQFAAPTAARPKITHRIEPGPQQAPATPAPGAVPGAGAAQKVVLYEEDPADPNGKRFVGSAIWRTETVTPGPGQPPELAIRADVEVPERKLAMTFSFRRNTDKGLPATHTVEVTFKLPADFPAGGISNVPGILMKQAESTRGVPLAGLAVKVTPGFYLVGLSSQEADKERNLQLLKERGWFDIPVVYNNNRRAIVAIEKGTPGDLAFANAFKAWERLPVPPGKVY